MCIRDSPNNVRLNFFSGVFLHRLSQPDAAIERVKKALEHSPKKTSILLTLAEITASTGDPQAGRYYQQAIELAPQDPRVQAVYARYQETQVDSTQ